LASPNLYQPNNKSQLVTLTADKNLAQQKLQQLETEWLSISETLEGQ